jgi:alpha-ketoglutarate-dependent taurine dioxygenase
MALRDILVCIDGTAAGHVWFDDETFAAIERAYYDHAVIFFRDQHIAPAAGGLYPPFWRN